jgi:hypothetical protein
MTSEAQSLHSVGDHQLDEQRTKCDISFEIDEVHLVVEQPAQAADQERYNSAQVECLQRMVTSPPTTFECKISGRTSAPRTEVIFRRTMVEKLPLLLDISASTSSTRQEAGQLELPCSVWGFVSLLLVLEGNLKLSHWFQGDSTSLPTQTLLVCAWILPCRCNTLLVCTRGCKYNKLTHPALRQRLVRPVGRSGF